jgi:translation elongation factor EF-Tu-like GTPase
MEIKKSDESTVEEVLLSQAYTVQALIRVLERKGVLTRNEVLEELEEIKRVMDEEVFEVACLI